MNKYVILFILNFPFVLYGYIKIYIYWETKRAGRLGIFLRLLFWTSMLAGLILASPIYNFLISNKITNSPRLSLADVVLATGVNFNLFIIVRLYSRVDNLEIKFTELIQKQSLSKLPPDKR